MGWKATVTLAVCALVGGFSALWSLTAPPRVPVGPDPPPLAWAPCPPAVVAASQLYLRQPTGEHLVALSLALRDQPERHLDLPPGMIPGESAPPTFRERIAWLRLWRACANSSNVPIICLLRPRHAELYAGLDEALTAASPAELRATEQDLARPDPFELLPQDADRHSFLGLIFGSRGWLQVRDEDQAVAWDRRIQACRQDLLTRQDWAGYLARGRRVTKWQERVSPKLSQALHPGLNAATREESFDTVALCQASLLQGNWDALPLKIAARLGQTPTRWPADPFDRSRRLTLKDGEVWSVGPDKVVDGFPVSGTLDYGSRGDVKL